jgi:3-dehydroquinate synthase
VLTDARVGELYAEEVADWLAAAGLEVAGIHTEPVGEGSKSLPGALRVLEALSSLELERGGLLVALGGGVIGDLGGFVASIYRRGIPLAQLPTSLLAQVDSCLGGKTAVNLPSGRNLAGTFHQPAFVLAVTSYLETLEPRYFRSGLGEALKYGVLGDPTLVDWISGRRPRRPSDLSPEDRAELVSRCLAAKASVVQADELEAGPRRVLNLGHTLGHALEAVTGYGEALYHGEAVAVGMVTAARLAVARGLAQPGIVERLHQVLTGCGLPVDMPLGVDHDELLQALRQDKKRQQGRAVWVLPTAIGQVAVVDDVTDTELLDAIQP